MSARVGLTSTLTGASLGEIGYVSSMSWDGLKCGVIEFKWLTMSGGYARKGPGIIQPGTMTVACIQDFASGDVSKHKAALDALAAAEDIDTWTLAMPDNQSMEFDGYLRGVKPLSVGGSDDPIGFELTIKVTSRPVLS